jgi:hypothetical protein
MVEEKTHCCVSDVVKCVHGFNLFGKVIDCQDNLLVSITRWRMESHEVYAPFTEGSTVMTRCRRVGNAHALFSYSWNLSHLLTMWMKS